MKLRSAHLTFLLVLLLSLFVSVSAKYPEVSAEGEWISVRSKNFFLIGDAQEKDIRAVATRLEQFREVFRLLFPNTKFSQSIGTNVVVFKNEKSYLPFLPKRADGKADTGIGGYFQPGEDVNYITLSAEGNKQDTYGIIFHEYVHFILNTNFGRSEIPPWFNEGLAEYYQTFKIEDDQKVYLGNLQESHLYLLQTNPLIPLKTFFEIDNYSLHQNGNHSRSIFYAQAWALIHYLVQSNQSANMSKFLALLEKDVESETAFRQAFGLDYAAMEKILKDYAKQRKFSISVATFKNKLVFDTEMTAAPLTETEANAYLGDLLYHTQEYADAEIYLNKALMLDSENSLANTSLGLVKMRQRKFDEAKRYLQKAIQGNRRNHFAHYNYAYVLSREGLDEAGRVTGYPAGTADIMRKSLLEAININPDFTESYRLLAFINLVNNENLEQSLNLMNKALALQPGNEDYHLTIAHIYLRQERYAEAEKIAAKIAKNAFEPEMRSQAENLLSNLKTLKENRAEMEKFKREAEESETLPPGSVLKSTLTEAEIARIETDNQLLAINRQVHKNAGGNKKVIGLTQKIECIAGGVRYTIKTDDGTLMLKSKDFQSLKLMAMSEESYNISVGCDTDMRIYKTVFLYKPENDPRMKTSGNLSGMIFVPDFFVLKSPEELARMKQILIFDDKERKRQMIEGIRASLRKPQTDEKRGIGILEKIECFKSEMIFRVKIGNQSITVKTDSPENLPVNIYTRDAAGIRINCGIKPPPVKAVITYLPDGKEADQGRVTSIEFVPDDFELK